MAETVFVVDDDRFSVAPLIKHLEDDGFLVSFFLNGQVALEAVKESPPDLVICDMLLPGLHGIEVTKEIRKIKEADGTKIILMTAVYKATKYGVEAREAGASLFWTKPIDSPKAVEEANRLLNRQSPQKEELEKTLDLELETLTDMFKEQLPDTLKDIRKDLRTFRKHLVAPELEGLREKVHKLAGSAGNFGLQKLGDSAKQLDLAVTQMLEQKVLFDESDADALDVHIKNLKQAMDHTSDPATWDSASGEMQINPNLFIIWSDDPFSATEWQTTLEDLNQKVELYYVWDDLSNHLKKEWPKVLIVVPPEKPDDLWTWIHQSGDLAIPHGTYLFFLSPSNSAEVRTETVKCGLTHTFFQPPSNKIVLAALQRVLSHSDLPSLVGVLDQKDKGTDFGEEVLEREGYCLVRMTINEWLESEVVPDVFVIGHNDEQPGMQTSALLRTKFRLQHVPIICISNKGQSAHKAVNHWVISPFEPEHLLATVESALHRSQLLQQAFALDPRSGFASFWAQEPQIIEDNSKTTKVRLALMQLDIGQEILSWNEHIRKNWVQLLREQFSQIWQLGPDQFLVAKQSAKPTWEKSIEACKTFFEPLESNQISLLYGAVNYKNQHSLVAHLFLLRDALRLNLELDQGREDSSSDEDG